MWRGRAEYSSRRRARVELDPALGTKARVTFVLLVFVLAQSHPSLHGVEKLLEGHLL